MGSALFAPRRSLRVECSALTAAPRVLQSREPGEVDATVSRDASDPLGSGRLVTRSDRSAILRARRGWFATGLDERTKEGVALSIAGTSACVSQKTRM